MSNSYRPVSDDTSDTEDHPTVKSLDLKSQVIDIPEIRKPNPSVCTRKRLLWGCIALLVLSILVATPLLVCHAVGCRGSTRKIIDHVFEQDDPDADATSFKEIWVEEQKGEPLPTSKVPNYPEETKWIDFDLDDNSDEAESDENLQSSGKKAGETDDSPSSTSPLWIDSDTGNTGKYNDYKETLKRPQGWDGRKPSPFPSPAPRTGSHGPNHKEEEYWRWNKGPLAKLKTMWQKILDGQKLPKSEWQKAKTDNSYGYGDSDKSEEYDDYSEEYDDDDYSEEYDDDDDDDSDEYDDDDDYSEEYDDNDEYDDGDYSDDDDDDYRDEYDDYSEEYGDDDDSSDEYEGNRDAGVGKNYKDKANRNQGDISSINKLVSDIDVGKKLEGLKADSEKADEDSDEDGVYEASGDNSSEEYFYEDDEDVYKK